MRWTIAYTLFVVLVLTSLVTLSLNAALVQWRFERDFLSYKAEVDAQALEEVASGFARYYSARGGWGELSLSARRWRALLAEVMPRRRRFDRGPPEIGGPSGLHPKPRPGTELRLPQRPPPTDARRLGRRMGLYDASGVHLAGNRVTNGSGSQVDIAVAGAVVGQLRLAPPRQITEALDLRFARGQGQSWLLAGLLVLALSTVASLLLARLLSRPIGVLANRARAMTAGDYEPQLEPVGSGELSALAQDLNELARTLDQNRTARRQWISDISHELRTPLAILMAELQALEDGIRPFDDSTRASLQREVERLTGLVHDLYELSASDEGNLSMRLAPLNPLALLDEQLESARPRFADHGLTLTSNLLHDPVQVLADSARLGQLFTNLMENSLRYTTAPGELKVSASASQQTLTIVFEDSAPGVPDAALQRVFDRLYRVDASRGRQSGGSGLGLAICSAIVTAHHGQIEAAHSSLGGLRVQVSLPIITAGAQSHD